MAFNFGGTATAPASTGFSFGATTPAASTGGFSFGNKVPAAISTSTGSSSFSFGATSAAATSTAPATSGFGFGSAPAASSSGFSFGSTPAIATAPASTGFGFGAPAATSASSGFSFGSTPATSTASSGGFGFGNTTTSTTTTPSLFGSAATAQSTGFGFGNAVSTGFGAAPATGTGMFALANTPATPAITLETAFETLPADIKKNIVDFHAFLKEEDQSDAFLKTVSPRKRDELEAAMRQLEQDVLARRNLQNKQDAAVQHVRKDVRQLIRQVDTATLNLRSLDGQSASHVYHHIMRRVEMPSPYYWDLLDHYEQTMASIKTQIEDVEANFKPLYDRRHDKTAASANDVARLQHILVAQNTSLMQLAAHVADVHARADEMRALFLTKMRQDMQKHGDANAATFQNPFEKRKKNAMAEKNHTIDNIRFRTSVSPTIVPTTAAVAPAAAPAAAPTSGFSFGTTPSTGTSLFGGGASPAAAPAMTTTTSSNLNFGYSSAAPKTVSFAPTTTAPATGATGFSSTSAFGAAPATSTAAPSLSFGAPAPAAPSAFGSITSSFLPADGGADKKGSGARRGSAAGRQKKRS